MIFYHDISEIFDASERKLNKGYDIHLKREGRESVLMEKRGNFKRDTCQAQIESRNYLLHIYSFFISKKRLWVGFQFLVLGALLKL